MTNVISPPARKAGDTAAPTVISILPALGSIDRQQVLENVLCMALYHVRHDNTHKAVRVAPLKAVRAASMFEHDSTEETISRRA